MDVATLRYYEDHAGEVAPRYEAVAGGVSSFFPFVFSRGERVLEIGAGSGRDAARLLALGVEVDAVEPSAALRERAFVDHPELEGRLFRGFLPGGLPPEIRPTYDGILLSAVIMHIPDAELFDAAFQLRERLVRGGRLVLSMPIERSDVTPGDERDKLGRLMILRSVTQVRLLFERLGFSLDHDWTSADGEGRGILWATLVFRLSEARSRAIDRVESIINADRKVATYKLALIRALCDIATTSWASGRWERGGSVGVPLQEVSEKWLRYYWPLLDSDVILPQINAESKDGKQIAFRGKLTELVHHFPRKGGLAEFERLVAEGSLSAEGAALKGAALSAIGSAIVKGPVQFAGNARGEPEFSWDKVSERILVPADVWRELSLMGHWICDAVILRWAEMTARLSQGTVGAGTVVDKLLESAEPLRADPVIREFYEKLQEGLMCVWTGTALRAGFEVDHAIPFTYWQASPSWNLFPASWGANNSKRDKLPTAALIRRRKEPIVGYWRMLADRFPARFGREASALLGSEVKPAAGWEKPLLSGFIEAVEYTASVRGAGRWEP